MSSVRTPLGDSHNFGRHVALRGDRVAKPRTLTWEWLTLSKDSPLRRLLDEAATRDGLAPAFFDFVPQLKFYPPGVSARDGGEVERVVLEPLAQPLSVADRRELATIVGRSLALWSWLGVSDLHWENLVLGIDAGAGRAPRMVFGPLDVEMILADLSWPTETKLLPDADPEVADICRHACGVRRVLPYLGKPVQAGDLLAMVGEYHRTLVFLDRHASEIALVFGALPSLQDIPIRVCLRGTEE